MSRLKTTAKHRSMASNFKSSNSYQSQCITDENTRQQPHTYKDLLVLHTPYYEKIMVNVQHMVHVSNFQIKSYYNH